jgi:hypothetical protein
MRAHRLFSQEVLTIVLSSTATFVILPIFATAWPGVGGLASVVLVVLVAGYFALVISAIKRAAPYGRAAAGVAVFFVWINSGAMLFSALVVSGDSL